MPDPIQKTDEEPEKILFSWKAKSRPFKKRSREFYVTLVSIVAVVGFVLFLAEGAMPVILLASLVFLFYILNTIEPEEVEYKITNKGIKIANRETFWENISRHWFTQRSGSNILVFETYSFPGRLELLYNSTDKEEIKKAIGDKVVEEKSPPTYVDRVTDWVASKLPRT